MPDASSSTQTFMDSAMSAPGQRAIRVPGVTDLVRVTSCSAPETVFASCASLAILYKRGMFNDDNQRRIQSPPFPIQSAYLPACLGSGGGECRAAAGRVWPVQRIQRESYYRLLSRAA